MSTAEQLIEQVYAIIKDKNPDFREITADDFHTHTIDDNPQLTMLFSTGRFSIIDDIYYNNTSKIGYIAYSNGLLINYGEFTYDNTKTETRITFPLSYNTSNSYSLLYNTISDYTNETIANEPLDTTHKIYIFSRDDSGFIVRCNQLYVPNSLRYNYFAMGFRVL